MADIDKFVKIYDDLGIDFAHQELMDCHYLIFLPSDSILFGEEGRASYIQFNAEGKFMRQQF